MRSPFFFLYIAMGKSKKGSSKAAAAAPKCNCDHPFKCDCGNRPERPSRGHKWDSETQEWGGKGHKQKGGSGQTSQTAQAAKVTSLGNTQIAQWQRLPSTLLNDYCKRDKRRQPKFKNISKGGRGSYLCRVILPDNKDPNKDLFFVPAKAVDNEEQANEEACILALLSLTPSLPHERMLPEPYRTTWLHAIENIKASAASAQSKGKKDDKDSSATGAPAPSSSSSNNNDNNNNGKKGGAKASTSLTLGITYTSKVDRQKQIDDKRRERNKRIRKHEAVRLANKNHPVFLAAHLRQHIQNLLRGDISDLPDLMLEDDDNDEDSPEDGELNDGEAYVLERLCHEGFTKRQVRTALQSIQEGKNGSREGGMISEDKWDSLYEECLQWLCIHLDEDQLPEGFDPRGGTLDVIVPGAVDPSSTSSGSEQNIGKEVVGKEISDFASQYGISNKEAKLISDQAKENSCDPEKMLWTVLQKAAVTSLVSSAEKSEESEEVLNEEIEALEAIYPSEFQFKKDGNVTILAIKVTDVDTEMTLTAVVETGVYPMAYPISLLLHGKWPKGSMFGAALHVETIKFMSNMDLGTPMLFEIYGEVQTLFHSISGGELQPLSLLSTLGINDPSSKINTPKPAETIQKVDTNGNQKANNGNARAPRKAIRRPRTRAPFWATPPNKTPFATAFPKIDGAMDRARKSLPAFKARSEFLAAMAKADKVRSKIDCDKLRRESCPPYLLIHANFFFSFSSPYNKQGGRVILVTGDTGVSSSCLFQGECCMLNFWLTLLAGISATAVR